MVTCSSTISASRRQHPSGKRAMTLRKHLEHGFTLVELMVTVTLLGVLLAIAVPSFRQISLNQGIRSASFDLFSALEYARSEAIKRNNTVSVQPDSTWSTGWKVVDSGSTTLR